jgi:phosphonate transport system substrate-binding protein
MVLSLLLGATSAQAICYGDQQRANSPIVFSPVPQLPVPTLFAKWAPLLDVLGKKTGQCFELLIKPTIPEFERLLLKGIPGLAYANPYHAVIAHKAKGYMPLLADGSSLLTGILVVKKGADINRLDDLQGRRVDFPAPNAFAASLLLRAHLQQLKINIEPRYVKTHSNVYRGVILGEAIAGGGVNKTLDNEPEVVRQQLSVLYESPGYRSHPVIASPRISPAIRKLIFERFVALSHTEAGRALLTGVHLNEPIAVTYQKDYRPLERLGLEKLVVLDE